VTIIAKLRAEIAERESKIHAIQAECSHPLAAVTEKKGANTGNYDPSSDCYWTDYHCDLCDKNWRVDHEAKVRR